MFLHEELMQEADGLLNEMEGLIINEGMVGDFFRKMADKVSQFIAKVLKSVTDSLKSAQTAVKVLKVAHKSSQMIKVSVQRVKDLMGVLQDLRSKAGDAFRDYTKKYKEIMSSKINEWKAIAHAAWEDFKAKLAAMYDAVVSRFRSVTPTVVEGKASDILKDREGITSKAQQIAEETKKMTDSIQAGIKSASSERVKGIFTTELGFIVKINKLALDIINQERATASKIGAA